MENTKIEWAHHTFNPWIGCSKVSPGCANCYAENLMDKRFNKAKWGPNGSRVKTSFPIWKQPLKWNAEAEKLGIRYRVFCASLADVFEDYYKQLEMHLWRAELFRLIHATPHLDWLLLTKRPGNIMSLLNVSISLVSTQKTVNEPLLAWLISWSKGTPPPNVWLGTSVENQEQADKRIPKLLQVPAKVHFLSMEPLLGPVDLTQSVKLATDNYEVPDWVIVGGESGPGARPMHPNWVRSLRKQCAAAAVPFFFKQWGDWTPYNVIIPGGNLRQDLSRGKVVHLLNGREEDGHFRKGDAFVRKVGKQAAGRQLDGREYNEIPEVER